LDARSKSCARLVDGGARLYGRFADRPAIVNPLDEFRGVERLLRRLRLKEWVGFTLTHPECFCSFVVQDANYLASAELFVFDRATRSLTQYARAARGGSLDLPEELFDGRVSFLRRGYAITYEFSRERGRHVLRFDIDPTKSAPVLRGELVLDARNASPPLSVSARLPSGVLYTHKAIFPASGELRVGERVYAFDAARDLAILDEHKSMLPYRTEWLWGTFALQAEGGLAGANLCARPVIPNEEDESCLWTPAACEPLAKVAFEPQSSDPMAPWHIHSRDERLDVTFTPEGRKEVNHQFGVVAIDYFQMLGRYRGVLRGAERTYEVNDVNGVCESMKARL
jgi:hypothetical protein